jgi:hypothetical protein
MHVNLVELGAGVALLLISFLREITDPQNPFVERQMDEWDRPQWSEEYSGDEDNKHN